MSSALKVFVPAQDHAKKNLGFKICEAGAGRLEGAAGKRVEELRRRGESWPEHSTTFRGPSLWARRGRMRQGRGPMALHEWSSGRAASGWRTHALSVRGHARTLGACPDTDEADTGKQISQRNARASQCRAAGMEMAWGGRLADRRRAAQCAQSLLRSVAM